MTPDLAAAVRALYQATAFVDRVPISPDAPRAGYLLIENHTRLTVGTVEDAREARKRIARECGRAWLTDTL